MSDEALPSRPMDFPVREHGRVFDDFAVGDVFTHHWGRTISEAEATVFATLTLAYCPLYFNAEYARGEGHPALVVHPMLALSTVVGQSVEDLSEIGGPFLGVDDLTFLRAVYPGDTLTATSEVVAARASAKRPGFGIVTWQTEGHNQHGEAVVRFRRSNLLRGRGT